MRHALGEDLARAQVAGDDGQALPVPHSSRGAGGGGRLVLPPRLAAAAARGDALWGLGLVLVVVMIGICSSVL